MTAKKFPCSIRLDLSEELADRLRAAADREMLGYSTFLRRFIVLNIDVIDPPEGPPTTT